jgi:sucrose phosphorylase
MVYQFSLAPLLLEALRTGNAGPLARWIASLGDDAPPGCTFFNFTASHDGIGVTPLKGLLSESRFTALLDDVRALGGRVSTRSTPTGELPYEMNIAYVSALDEVSGLSDTLAVRRFLTSQAIMLAMAGMPGVYFHSLVGTPNDVDGVTASGRARSINRRKYDADDLSTLLSDPTSRQGRIFAGYRRMLEIRRAQPAFHPEGAQHPVAVDDPAVVAFLRTSPDSSQRILVLANTAGTDRSPSVSIETGRRIGHDLLDGHELTGLAIPLAPWQCRWVALGA